MLLYYCISSAALLDAFAHGLLDVHGGHRVSNFDSMRLPVGKLVDTVTTSVANAMVTGAFINDAGEIGVQVAADIGTELRKLEAG